MAPQTASAPPPPPPPPVQVKGDPPSPAPAPPRGWRRRVRVILFNGWLRTYTYPRLWMAPLSARLRATRYAGAEVEVVGNTVPAQTNDVEKYVRHLAELVGPQGPDEDTFFIGQSVGCQVILRYLAQLPASSKVGGWLSVGCWMYLDRTTRKRRSRAIEELINDEWEGFQRWMDYSAVDFENVRRVCPEGKLLALMSNDDPYRGLDDGGLSNKRDWEEMVGARVVFRKGKGHFNSLRLDAEDTALVEQGFLGLTPLPEGEPVEPSSPPPAARPRDPNQPPAWRGFSKL